MISKYWIPFSKSQTKSEKMYNNYINGGLDKQLRAVAEWLGSQECIDAYKLNRQKLRSYLQNSNLHKDLNKIIHENVGNSEEYIEKFYKQGAKNGCKDIQQTLRFTKADKEALYHLKQYNFELIQNLNEDLKNEIKSTLTEGIIVGAAARELGAQINELPLKPIGNISPKARANMIARTEYSRALITGNLQSFANYGVSTVEVITAGDDYVCDLCLDMEEKNPYPVDYEDLPPFHPNCRCAVAPVSSLSPYTAEPVANPPVINQIPTEENKKGDYDFNGKKILSPEEFESMSFEELAEYHGAEYKGLVVNKGDGKNYHLFNQKYDQGRFLEIYVEEAAVKGYKGVSVNKILNEVFKVPESMKRETDSIWFKNTQEGIMETNYGYDIIDDFTLGYNQFNKGKDWMMTKFKGVQHEIVINPQKFKLEHDWMGDRVDKVWQKTIHHEFAHSKDLTRELFEKDVAYWQSNGKNGGKMSNCVTSSEEWKKLRKKYEEEGFTDYANQKNVECYAEHMGYISFMEANPKFWDKEIYIEKTGEEINYKEYKKLYKDMYEFCINQLKRR